VHCQQGTSDRKWDDVVDLAPNETRTLRHAMRAKFAVAIGMDGVAVDGVPHKRGEVLQLVAARYEVRIPNAEPSFVTIREACTITVRAGHFDCYP
jgi:hypothetical protein